MTHPLDQLWRGRTRAQSDEAPPDEVAATTAATRTSKRDARKRAAPRKSGGDDFVAALARGLEVLHCWRGGDVWLANSELSDRSGLTRATVSRLTSVLVDLGYLARDRGRGRFRLTAATLELGFGSVFSVVSGDAAQAALYDLAREADVYAALSIRRDDTVQVVENAASPYHPDAVAMDVGGVLPICRSASGLAALSTMTENEVTPLVARMRSHYGALRWSAIQPHVRRAQREFATNGYCSSVGILSPRVGAIATPIAVGGTSLFVLACGVSVDDFDRDRVERSIAPRMLAAAATLSRTLSL